METGKPFLLDQTTYPDRPLAVPAGISQTLDDLVDALAKLTTDAGAPPVETLAASLERITGWLSAISEPQEKNSETGDWSAAFLGVSGMGGSVQCEQGSRFLLFSLNAKNQPYLCVWDDITAFDPGQEVYLRMEPAPGGTKLSIQNALVSKQLVLPSLSGGGWSSETDFFQTLTGMRLPDETGKTAAAEPPPPAPDAVPAEPEARHCARCGSLLKPGKKFCGQCGAPVTPPAPAVKVCPYCGKTLSMTARFCGNCGHPQP